MLQRAVCHLAKDRKQKNGGSPPGFHNSRPDSEDTAVLTADTSGSSVSDEAAVYRYGAVFLTILFQAETGTTHVLGGNHRLRPGELVLHTQNYRNC